MSKRIYVKGGVWSNAEDTVLVSLVTKHGLYAWDKVATALPKKNAKLAQARWDEWLNPRIEKGPWTPEEDKKLLELYQIWSNQWRTISEEFDGRRTAQQCISRYNDLIKSTTGGAGDAAADVIDTSYLLESRAAVGDATNLDMFERQMIDDARGRVANTSGKKGLRKERTKQMEQSRLLSKLQMVREMKEAGIEVVSDPLLAFKKKLKIEKRRPMHDEDNDQADDVDIVGGGGIDDSNDGTNFVPVSLSEIQGGEANKRGKRGREGEDGEAAGQQKEEELVTLGRFPDSIIVNPNEMFAPLLQQQQQGGGSTSSTGTGGFTEGGRLPRQQQQALLGQLNQLNSKLKDLPFNPSSMKSVSSNSLLTGGTAISHASAVLDGIKKRRPSQADLKRAAVAKEKAQLGWMKKFGNNTTAGAAFPSSSSAAKEGYQSGGTKKQQFRNAVGRVLSNSSFFTTCHRTEPTTDTASSKIVASTVSTLVQSTPGLTHAQAKKVYQLIDDEAAQPTFIPELEEENGEDGGDLSNAGLKRKIKYEIAREYAEDGQLENRVASLLRHRNPYFQPGSASLIPSTIYTDKSKKGSTAGEGVVLSALTRLQSESLESKELAVQKRAEECQKKEEEALDHHRLDQNIGTSGGGPLSATNAGEEVDRRNHAARLGLAVYSGAQESENAEIEIRRKKK